MPGTFEDALRAVEGPLRFASGDGFARLDRVVDLERSVEQAARRALTEAPSASARAALQALLDALPTPGAPRNERVRALQICLEQVERARSEPPRKNRPPPRTATSGVRPLAVRDVRRKQDATPLDAPVEPAPEVVDEPKSPVRKEPADATHPPELSWSLQYLKGVGPRLAAAFEKRGLLTVEDLLRFLPRRYEDRRGQKQIADLEVGTRVTVEAEVIGKSLIPTRGRRRLEVVVADPSGALTLTWFRVPGRGYADRFVKGTWVRVSGEVKRYRGRLQIAHPETQVLGDKLGMGEHDDAAPEDALVPVYLDIEGIRPAHLRRIMGQALQAAPALPERLPRTLHRVRALPTLAQAIAALHRPPPGEVGVDALTAMRTPWHQRLIYEELFLLQLAVLRRKAVAALEPGRGLSFADNHLVAVAEELFSFTLTGAQSRVCAEIEADLRRDVPMNRLLQGDVGSGKTAVALSAAATVARCGHQAAIMAPTEILAEQHARTALGTLTGAGIRVALLTGTVTGSERRRLLAQLRAGEIQVLIGTHALIQEGVRFDSLALGIVDEQHRFGVKQRARVLELGRESFGATPHTLVMTATPIPRTLALTVYGDLDASIIDELPPGRSPIETKLFSGRQRASVYREVEGAVREGRQAYVIFPLVEESDREGMDRLRDATSAAEELANGPLASVRVGLLHGRMSGDEKDAVMRRFVGGTIDVLVATTVVEVGIDVPNATVMVVEHAERFGLSQLHQLRGRVGRGQAASQCLLVAYATQSEDALFRLRVMEESQDGFRIAEEDLALRGPGDFLGTRQSGLPMLSVADLVRDHALLVAAREDAGRVLAEDPELARPEHAVLRAAMAEQWADRLELAQIG